jgi:hypothetical protein
MKVIGLTSKEEAEVESYLGPVPVDDFQGECLCLSLAHYKPRHFSQGEVVSLQGIHVPGKFRIYKIHKDVSSRLDQLYLERTDD